MLLAAKLREGTRSLIKSFYGGPGGEDDFHYIGNEREIREEVERYERQIYEDGQEEGIEKGIKQGEQRGEKIKAVEIATKLKAKGFDDEIIAEVTGLTLEEIAHL